MADRVHPAAYPDEAPNSELSTSPLVDNPGPPSSAFVIQIPKDQIYRVPPPENDYLYKRYARRAARRSRHSCCGLLCYSLLALLLLLAVAAGVLWLVFRPRAPSYSLASLSVSGLNLSDSRASSYSPEFDAAVRASNPNAKIGIYYRDGGDDIAVSYGGAVLAHGVWPAFYQGHRNVTVLQTVSRGSGIRIAAATRSEMLTAEKDGAVPLTVDVKVPVRVKFGIVTAWTVRVKVRCNVTVDKLAATSRIVSSACHVKLRA